MEADSHDAGCKKTAEVLVAHAAAEACRYPYKFFGFFQVA